MSEPAAPTLPAIPDPSQLQRLHPGVRRVWLFGAATTALVLLALLVPGAAFVLRDVRLGPVRPVWIALALGLYPLVRSVLLVDRQYKNWGYLLTDRELVTRHGLWWTSATFIPRESIQHVDINQGPIDRWQGLAQIVVHTAGTGAVAFIPGLGLAEAQMLRDRLVPEPGESE